jgi:hypothetical protein
MAISKKSSISSQERLGWLEQLENGTRITKITTDAGHNIRTVKRHIEIAREERHAAMARHGFLLKRLEQHQDDLLKEVNRLRKLLMRHPPTLLTPRDPTEIKILEALREHIKRLPLKNLLERWEVIFAEYSSFRGDVRIKLDGEKSRLLPAMLGEDALHQWTPTIVDVLVSGLSPEESGRTYIIDRQDGKYKVSWGDNILTRSPITEEQKDLVLEAHKKLVTFAKNYLPGFLDYKERFRELSDQLIDELDVLRIKRVVIGRCRYCPA